jgi:ribose 1,5-bisphosphate isomerase
MNLPSQVIKMLEEIKADNRSGAAEILRKAAAVYQAVASTDLAGRPPDGLDLMIDCISSVLRRVQPGMVGLLNMVRAVDHAIHHSGGTALFEVAARAASEFAESASRMTAAAAARGAQLITDKAVVLTHSRSSTVLASLLGAASSGRSFSLIATESRPMLEGRQVAEVISNAGIHVTVIVDAAATQVMNTVDLFLVGADRVTPEHVLNKIGTTMIALAARSRGIPAYCLADTSKFTGERSTAELPARPDAEVWPDSPAGISIINRYFEEVPIDLFTGIVTEGGPLEPLEAGKLAKGQGGEPLSGN